MSTTEVQYGSLREKIRAEKAEREAAYANFERVSQLAHEKGHEAATAVTPTPMVVQGYEDTPVMDGICGFGWIWFKGNTRWGRWAKKNLGAGKSYPGGLQIWVGDYNQSYTRKAEYARAYAQVLREELGIDAYGQSRVD